jgi:putative PIN family toxin of toxin-antitoxin system
VRTVLDSNVLIASLLSRDGTPARLVARWLRGEFDLVVSPQLLSELERALMYPKLRGRIDSTDRDEFIDLLRRSAVVAEDATPVPRSADAADDYLIALAEAQRAVLVSGDKHLLDLADAFPIESPTAFLRRLDSQE